ncbi:MAG: hypothetical protein KC425_01680 [Anaerolineales bacterium]|nr:hypothetical protein [Anaerolineales bacterium]
MKITPTTVIDTRPARPEDLPLVLAILGEAAAWLRAKGMAPWPALPDAEQARRMAAAIARGEVYTIGIVKNRFGVVRLTWADAAWPDAAWPDDGLAAYVHDMALRAEMHGQNLGAGMLFWAALQARQRGRPFVRLCCLAENGRLRRYFEAQGFGCRGEVVGQAGTLALYEKAV